MALYCRYLVNAAGLEAQAIGRALQGFDPALVPARHLAKGNYFVLGPRPPFRHLIYPMPEAAGLGVHLTLDLAGRARFGPDVEWIEALDYRVDPRRGRATPPSAAIGRACPTARWSRLCGDPAQAPGAGRAARGFRHPGAGAAWRAAARQSLRHRITGPHRLLAIAELVLQELER
jgi:hypothetical protein